MILGIGSRIKYPELGMGIVINITSKLYWVTFIDKGLETIDINGKFEVIERVENEVDTVSFYEVEKTIRTLLKRYSDISEIVAIADKWKGGILILQPEDSNLSSKEISIDIFFHKIVIG